MAQYQKIEYRIGADGKIVETVLNGVGSSCTENTSGIEKALGKVESQKLFPEYYQDGEELINEETQNQTEM